MDNKNKGWILIIIGFILVVFLIIKVIISGEAVNEFIFFMFFPGCFSMIYGIFVLNGGKTVIKNENKMETAPIIINTKFVEVREHYDRDNGSDYYIITSWVNPDDKKIYFFNIVYVGSDYTEIIKKNDIKLPVTYEAGNIENYKMDISILKEINYEQSK